MKRWMVLLICLIGIATVQAQTDSVTPGCILYAPMLETTTYLVNNAGETVHTWQSDTIPAAAVYLLENGLLLRTAHLEDAPIASGDFPGMGGRIEVLDRDSNPVQIYEYATERIIPHHDLVVLPNGNLLLLAWEAITVDEALAAGRKATMIPNGRSYLLADLILEVNPLTDEIVWVWRALDHLASEPDPRRIDINYRSTAVVGMDMIYLNSIDYDPQNRRILVSSRTFSEIWVIDHSISSEEARGAGGDLVFRWGNPAAYGAAGERQLFYQHHAHWIKEGLPGAGNIMVFNNGMLIQRPFSEVLEIDPGSYDLEAAPQIVPVWSYRAPRPQDFFSGLVSSAYRQPNGNTLITDGLRGNLFEVNAAGETVWSLDTGQRIFRAERYPLAFTDALGVPAGACD